MRAKQPTNRAPAVRQVGTLVGTGSLDGEDLIAVRHEEEGLPGDPDRYHRAGGKCVEGADMGPGGMPRVVLRD